MKSIIVNLVFLAVVITSCARTSDETYITDPVEKTSYNFVYGNSYEVNDIVLYKGPGGSKQTPQEKFIANVWSTYTTPEYDQIEVDIKEKIIHFHVGKNINDYQIELSKDSIFIAKDKVFVGILDRKNERLKLSKSFYYIRKHLEDSQESFSKFTRLGITDYKDVFGAHSFINPAEMTDENDEIFWANLSFSYTPKK